MWKSFLLRGSGFNPDNLYFGPRRAAPLPRGSARDFRPTPMDKGLQILPTFTGASEQCSEVGRGEKEKASLQAELSTGQRQYTKACSPSLIPGHKMQLSDTAPWNPLLLA